MSDQAFEDWKSLRAYAYDLSRETTPRTTYDSIPVVTRRRLRPLISKFLKSLKDVPVIQDVINETASYHLDEFIGAEELEHSEVGVGLDGNRKVHLETLREHIAAGDALLNATRIEPESVIAMLQGLLGQIDRKIEQFVKATNVEWTQLRQPWEGKDGKLAKLQQLLHSCEDSEHRQARLREEYHMGNSWVGGWSFAKKGNIGSKPFLWIRQGMDQSILDRCVIKDTQLNSMQWNKKFNHFWYDPLDPGGGEKTVHSEIAAMAALRDRKASTNIVNLRNWRMFEDRQMYRLYLEFCPHGDLGQWTGWYKEHRDANLAQRNYFTEPVKPDDKGMTNSEKKKALLGYLNALAEHNNKMRSKDPVKIAAAFHKTRDELERAFLPEPFLWHTFECLARAGQEMEQPAEDDKWEIILHLDYKPRNIFLGLPDDGQYKGYPVPKTGDYGLAKMVPPGDKRNANLYPDCGTPFCRPREQTKVPYPGEEGKPRRRMDAKTNVWGVGIVMWSLLELEDGDHRLSYEDLVTSQGVKNDGDRSTLDRPTFRKAAENYYSRDLRDLILMCLSHEQQHRPSFEKLLLHIEKCTGKSEKADLANGLRSASEDDPKWQEEQNVLPSLNADTFKGYLTGLSTYPDGMDGTPAPPTSGHEESDNVPGSGLGADSIVQRRLRGAYNQQGQAQVGAIPQSPKRETQTPSKTSKRKRSGDDESGSQHKSTKHTHKDPPQEDIDRRQLLGQQSPGDEAVAGYELKRSSLSEDKR
ncbi:G2-specific protein kinase nimA [Pseudocercospora fuligena]|uniref:non-specific serine/threonine protein kinase n=1 Tax=Pseudocercospora fuligena TaxID=685502 RepID=A0A8H6RP36_9PEZI|nr:G2-specific protein kinase nimA [Pseudocercospora fuligena]